MLGAIVERGLGGDHERMAAGGGIRKYAIAFLPSEIKSFPRTDSTFEYYTAGFVHKKTSVKFQFLPYRT